MPRQTDQHANESNTFYQNLYEVRNWTLSSKLELFLPPVCEDLHLMFSLYFNYVTSSHYWVPYFTRDKREVCARGTEFKKKILEHFDFFLPIFRLSPFTLPPDRTDFAFFVFYFLKEHNLLYFYNKY